MRRFSSTLVFQAALVTLITAVVFLPNLTQATIYRDDWYYTLDRMKGGAQIFHAMFAIDRPLRGYFFEGYYRLFGMYPAGYHAMNYLLRVLVGLAGMGFFRALFPGKKAAALTFAILLALYPGYGRWMEGFEDQPTSASLALEVTSIALSLAAVRSRKWLVQGLLWLGAIISGWGYILLVDYAAGMEVFRLACICGLVWIARQGDGGRFAPRAALERVGAGVKAWLPGALIPAGWLIWRFFFFHNARPETDLSLQLATLMENPRAGLLHLSINYVRSVVYTLVQAWSGPAFHDLFGLPNRVIVLGLCVGAAAAAASALGLALAARQAEPENEGIERRWPALALLLGAVGVLAGVIPVVIANRWVMFQAYSHYAVPASLASALFVTGGLGMLGSRRARAAALAGLVFLAASSQFSVSRAVLAEEQTISAFWQQVAWRAPGLRAGTGLVVSYPGFTFGEDVDAVNGPANFLYYPGPVSEVPVPYSLYAMKQYAWTAQEYRLGKAMQVGYRTHYGTIDPAQVLVITQARANACVHVIDRRWPWFAYDERETILLVGPGSDTSNILTGGTGPSLDSLIFGRPRAADWCYIFEQADLAAQSGDWQAALRLAQTAEQQGLKPSDRLEWMPFLQAAAALGDLTALNVMIDRITDDAYGTAQACGVLRGMLNSGIAIPDAARQVIAQRVCAPAGP